MKIYPKRPEKANDLRHAPFPVRRIAIRYRVSIAHASTIAHLAQIGGAA